jgi:hypothetical protein
MVYDIRLYWAYTIQHTHTHTHTHTHRDIHKFRKYESRLTQTIAIGIQALDYHLRQCAGIVHAVKSV